ncbi:MAG: hydantoinase B/oxoprolinase family protein [Acidobacteria bacterium]|nr:hydantoinase B/oxoprolinase family protein [Acidobacteriota bacterium]
MKRPDPVELGLFRHLLASICDEMGVVLRKSAYSVNIKERRDYSCAVYDERGETVAMGDHMPVHLGAMPDSVRQVRASFDLGPGDVAIVNDPFRGGTHLPDITAVRAVFLPGTKSPRFYVANRAHHSDVGGMSPGSMPLAREIYQEGLRIPPMLLVRRGRLDRDFMNLILANVRTPVEREGDIQAQLSSLHRGAARLIGITKRYGAAAMERNLAALCAYSGRMMRARLAGLPDGQYSFEDFLDNDGITPDPVRVAVTITVSGDEAVVDFTGSSPQAAGPVNANHAIAVAATTYCFRCLLDEDVPFTAGLMDPVRIINPAGTVTNAQEPAAMAAGNVETSQRITDTVLGALAQAAPGRIPAASSGTMNNLSFGGWDSVRRRAFAYYETIAGGMGGHARGPGQPAVHTHMTNSLNTPVEAFEHQYPVRVRAYRVRAGSGGAGKHPGGDGIRKELEFLEPTDVTILSDRRARGPYGLAGGEAGQPGANWVERRGRRQAVGAKARFTVEPGAVLGIETPGGGGHQSVASSANASVE